MKLRALGVVALLGSWLSTAACLNQDGGPYHNASFFIIGAKTISGACTYDPSEGGPFYSRGTLDLVTADRGYTFPALIKNQMPVTTEVKKRQTSDLRVDTSLIILEQAEINYEFSGALAEEVGVAPEAYSPYTSGAVPPGGGLFTVTFPLVSSALLTTLRDAIPDRTPAEPRPTREILATVQIHGRTLDGMRIASSSFTFPLEICKGCLLTFPPIASEGDGPPNCRAVEGVENLQQPCLVGQDEFVDCRICRVGKPIAQRNQCEPM